MASELLFLSSPTTLTTQTLSSTAFGRQPGCMPCCPSLRTFLDRSVRLRHGVKSKRVWSTTVESMSAKPRRESSSPSPSPVENDKNGKSKHDNDNETLLETSSDDQTTNVPMYNSTLLTAMRDYFGDDGREMQEYMRRPRTAETIRGEHQPMFRILLVLDKDDNVKLAKQLQQSSLMRGLYYFRTPFDSTYERRIVVDEDDDIEELRKYSDLNFVERSALDADSDIDAWAQLAQSPNEPDEASLSEITPRDLDISLIVEFSEWACVDAVFIGQRAQQSLLVEESGANVQSDALNDLEQLLAQSGITLFQWDVGKAIVDKELDVLDCLSSLIQEEDVSEALLE